MARTIPIHDGYAILNGAGTGSNGGKIDVWVEYQVESQDISNNTSFVRAYFYAALREGQSTSTKYANGLNSTFSVNGTSGNGVSNGAYDFTSPANIHTLGTFAGTIAHNADGSKSITIAGSFTTKSSYISGGNVSGAVALPTIPRATVPTVVPATMGEATTITLSPASASFTHSLRWRFGNATGGITGITAERTITYTFPVSVASEIPNSEYGTATVICDTYNGETLVGSKSVGVTLYIPDSMVPTSGALLAEQVDTEVPSAWGVFVQGKSRAKLTLQDATGAGGSSIVSYAISGGGFSGGSNPFITGLLLSSGAVSFSAYAKDSRGRQTAQKAISITVQPYDVPKCSNISIVRCTANGTPNEEGTYLSIYFLQQFSSCGGHNTAQTVLKYRSTGATSWDTSAPLTPGQTSLISGFSIANTYELSLEITDAFTTSSYQSILQTAGRIVNIRADGKGLALGKMSEKAGLEVAWAADFAKAPTIAGTALVDLIYPVGSIYMSMQNASPAETLGGTWEAITGAFLLPSEQSGQTGGNRTHQHAFGVRFHPYYGALVGEGEAIGVSNYAADGTISWQAGGWDGNVSGISKNSGLSAGTDTTTITRQKAMGATSFVEHMPPYLTVYAWKRTA